MMIELKKKLLTDAFHQSMHYSTIEQYKILVYLICAYPATAINI